MLYVTLASDADRGTRSKHDTDDPREAVAAALADWLPGVVEDRAIFCVVVERKAKLTKGDIAEAVEQIRSAEVKRAAR